MTVEPHIWARALQPEFADDFFRLHDGSDCGACFCMYWHHAGDSDSWRLAAPADLRAEKQRRIATCGDTGMLLYEDETPVGWCQFGPRAHFPKIEQKVAPPPGPEGLWVLNCFYMAPTHRRQGYARVLLAVSLEHLQRLGVREVEAYPVRGVHDPGEVWTGPFQLFVDAGFRIVRDDPVKPVLRKTIGG